MSWEKRGNRRYYYRARSVGGKVVKQYVGHGPEAEKAAREDAQKRAEREARLEARRESRRQYEAVQVTLAAVFADCDNLIRAALVQAGFHQHTRGEWRKRRASRNARASNE
jgi:hypothetical protein